MKKAEAAGSCHLVDPELLSLLDALPILALSSENLAEARNRTFPQAEPSEAASRVSVEQRRIPGPPGAPDVMVAVYRPPSSEHTSILHIHGGGYVMGSVEASRSRQRELAAALECVIVSVGYRLAPETSFPGPVEDCYAALAWLSRSAWELGLDPGRIVLKGESAGGGLAAALSLMARDRGEFHPLFQHLTYPMLDDRTGITRPVSPFAGEFVWTAGDNRFGWGALLGHEPGSSNVSPYAAPVRAEDLTGLPPSFLMVGGLDLFASECIEYAHGLTAAGVPTELHVYPGAFHGFDLAPAARVAIEAGAASLAALKRVCHTAKPT